MSWKTVNRILGQAAIDPAFRQRLQENPLTALEEQGFKLTPEEQEAFTEFRSLPFSQLCQRLLEKLAPEEHP
jgi:hypothetical protein